MSDIRPPTLDDLQDKVHQSLKSWVNIGSSDEELLEFLLLVKLERVAIEGSHDPLALRHATNRVLEHALGALASQMDTEAEVLRRRFIVMATSGRDMMPGQDGQQLDEDG